MIVLMSAFLLLSAFSCGGGNKANSTSEQSEETAVNVPQFDADSAYLYVKNQDRYQPMDVYPSAQTERFVFCFPAYKNR